MNKEESASLIINIQPNWWVKRVIQFNFKTKRTPYIKREHFPKRLFVHISFPHLNGHYRVYDFQRGILSLTSVKLMRPSFMARMYTQSMISSLASTGTHSVWPWASSLNVKSVICALMR